MGPAQTPRILRLLLEQPRTSVREYARILGVARGTLRPASTVSNATSDHRRGPLALPRGARPRSSRSTVHIEVTGHLADVADGPRRGAGDHRGALDHRRRDLLARAVARDAAHLEDAVQQLSRLPAVRTGPGSPCASGCRTGCCRWSRRSAGPRRRAPGRDPVRGGQASSSRQRPGEVPTVRRTRRGTRWALDRRRRGVAVLIALAARHGDGGHAATGFLPRAARRRRPRCAAPPHGAGPGGPAPLIRLR